MAIIRLVQGGPGVTLLVAAIADDKDTRNNPQWKFVGRAGTDHDAAVFLSTGTAQRQLTRIGLDRASAIGKSLEFVKNGKGFIDVSHATEQLAAPLTGERTSAAPTPAAAPAVTRTPAPAAAAPAAAPASNGTTDPEAERARKREHWQKSSLLYAFCEDHVLKNSIPKMVRANVPVTHEGTAAQIATLFDRLYEQGVS